MTTATFSAAPTNASDTSFRLWGKGISDALAAVGLIKTADTGQIDWATVIAPVSAGSYKGYEVWRFNDTLQSTAPLFLKINYGSGNSSTIPSFNVAIGKGSNGTGTLTGTLTGALTMSCTSGATATAWYVSSGDGSMLAISMAPAVNTITEGGLFVVERSCNAAGVRNGTAVFALSRGLTNVGVNSMNYALASGPTLGYWPATAPTAVTTTGIGMVGTSNKAPMLPAVITDGQGYFWQPRSVLVYAHADISPFAVVTVDSFGTYLPIGLGGCRMDANAANIYVVAAIAWA